MLACLSPVTNAVSLDILLPMVYQEDIDISN
jgi:hypothetical protein